MSLIKFSGIALFFSYLLFFTVTSFSGIDRRPVKALKEFSEKSYLALGDSYTIGESVSAENNFPHQLRNRLSQSAINISKPEIIAKTGWTTADLITSLKVIPPLKKKYDLVTLLIGVNNQFQNRSLVEFKTEFNYLLQIAVQYAGGPQKVIVISIPDYGVTPFAENYSAKEQKNISKQIKEFNKAQKKITDDVGIKFINITAISKKGKKDPEMQADDGLHPSVYQYAQWVEVIKPTAIAILK